MNECEGLSSQQYGYVLGVCAHCDGDTVVLYVWVRGGEGGRLEHIMLVFLPIILFRNSSYFNLLPYYHPIILTNLVESMHY